MFRNPLSRTTRIGSVVTGLALAGLSLLPMHSPVSGATRIPTISPAPLKLASSLPAPPNVPVKRKPHLAVLASLPGLSGMASWYGAVWHGHHSADGGIFDEHLFTAAHKTLPFGTVVRVVDLVTGRSVIVRITDRGTLAPGRIIDLSSAAADDLGILKAGLAKVRLEVLKDVSTAKIAPATAN